MPIKLYIATGLSAGLILSAAPAAAQQASARAIPHFRSTGLADEPVVRHRFRPCLEAHRKHEQGGAGFGCAGGGWVYVDGDWALFNNRSGEPDSYNDWWHDRPDRAYPRWVQEQRARGTCDPDRVWWSGAGWHC
jgi:hypothetical protein